MRPLLPLTLLLAGCGGRGVVAHVHEHPDHVLVAWLFMAFAVALSFWMNGTPSNHPPEDDDR